MNHILEVANRLQGLRDALELSVEEFAADCGVTPQEYTNYETGVKDIPVSFLHRIAARYGIELTALLFGEEPKMQSYFVTRAGKGVKVERTKAYSYHNKEDFIAAERKHPEAYTPTICRTLFSFLNMPLSATHAARGFFMFCNRDIHSCKMKTITHQKSFRRITE